MNEDDHVLEAVRRDDPMREVDLSAPPVQNALDAMGRGITEGSDRSVVVPLRRRKRRSVAIVGVVATTLLAVGTPAAAHWVSLHTGMFGSAGLTEVTPDEFLDTSSPELGPYLDTLAGKYPLPPGGTFEEAKRNAGRYRSLQQRVGLEGMLAADAQCQWTRWWLDGHAAGDTGKVTAATEVLQAIPAWPILHESDGGGVVAFAQEMANGAATGDATPLQTYWDANCVPGIDHTDPDLLIEPEQEGGR